MPIGYVWQTFLETPLVNVMVALSALLFGSYGLAILAFTVITRGITFPLTLKTLKSMRALQEIQPQLMEIQKKYSDPKRRSEETMKLYRNSGVNPLGCLGPQLIQLPIFIALYQVVRITLGGTPESVVNLSSRLYEADFIQNAVPMTRHFLGMDLGENGGVLLVLVVFAAMWLQQRISTNRTQQATQSAQQRQMTQMMQWMLPAMFAWFVFIVPAGLGLYWGASTIIGIILHWIFVGPGDFTWGSLIPNFVRARLGMGPVKPRPVATKAGGAQAAVTATAGEGDDAHDSNNGAIAGARDNDEGSRGQRKDRRRGRKSGAGATRSQSRSSRRRGNSRG